MSRKVCLVHNNLLILLVCFDPKRNTVSFISSWWISCSLVLNWIHSELHLSVSVSNPYLFLSHSTYSLYFSTSHFFISRFTPSSPSTCSLFFSCSISPSWFMIFTHVWKGHWPLLYNERIERVSIWTRASRTLWAHHHGNLQRDPHLFRVISAVIEFYNVHLSLFLSERALSWHETRRNVWVKMRNISCTFITGKVCFCSSSKWISKTLNFFLFARMNNIDKIRVEMCVYTSGGIKLKNWFF